MSLYDFTICALLVRWSVFTVLRGTKSGAVRKACSFGMVGTLCPSSSIFILHLFRLFSNLSGIQSANFSWLQDLCSFFHMTLLLLGPSRMLLLSCVLFFSFG